MLLKRANETLQGTSILHAREKTAFAEAVDIITTRVFQEAPLFADERLMCDHAHRVPLTGDLAILQQHNQIIPEPPIRTLATACTACITQPQSQATPNETLDSFAPTSAASIMP
jgi:hypothetical protein